MYINEQMTGCIGHVSPAVIHVLMGFNYPFAGNLRRRIWDMMIRKGFRHEYFQ